MKGRADMLNDIIMVTLVFLAMIGMIQIILAGAFWLEDSLPEGSYKNLTIIDDSDKEPEAKLRSVYAAMLRSSSSAGEMLVLCEAENENFEICRRFCEDRNIKMVARREDI